MRKSLAYFFLTCSLVLVIGHSMLPHNHDVSQATDAHFVESNALSLADIIKITLSHNLGANHLEEYRSYDALDFSEIAPFSEIIEEKTKEISVRSFLVTQFCPGNSTHLRSLLEPLTTNERGPPSLS